MEPEAPAPSLRGEAFTEVIENELRKLLSRSRSFSVELAQTVHPELEPALYVLLVQLAEQGEARAVDLANLRGVTKGVVSRQIGTLLRLGLLMRRPDPRDGRARVVVLTEAGHRAVRTAQAARQGYMRRLLEQCSEDELVSIGHSLRRLNELMG